MAGSTRSLSSECWWSSPKIRAVPGRPARCEGAAKDQSDRNSVRQRAGQTRRKRHSRMRKRSVRDLPREIAEVRTIVRACRRMIGNVSCSGRMESCGRAGRNISPSLAPGHKRFEIRNPPGHVRSDVTYLSLAEDRSGAVLASFGSDVGRYRRGRWEIVSEAKASEKERFRPSSKIARARFGSVLLGHGLRKWLGYGELGTMDHPARSCTATRSGRCSSDSRGRIWVADEHGLSILEPGASQVQILVAKPESIRPPDACRWRSRKTVFCGRPPIKAS